MYTKEIQKFLKRKSVFDKKMISPPLIKPKIPIEKNWSGCGSNRKRERTTKSKSRQDNFYEVEKKAKQQIIDEQLAIKCENRAGWGEKIIELKKIYKSYMVRRHS